MIDTSASTLLPPQYKSAEEALTKMLSARPLDAGANNQQHFISNPKINISKGFSVKTWKADASEDVLQISVKSADLLNSEKADAIGKMVCKALNEIEAVRAETVMVSPHEYLAQGKERLGELLKAAKDAGVPGSNIDYTKSVIFNPNLSRNQQQKFGTQIFEGPHNTSLRVNIPTNPDNKDKATALAHQVAEDLKRRLPEIKAEMIARIKAKNYIPNMTPEMEQKLQAHEFEVTTEQQANWTSVFIAIRSPEQVEARKNPGTTPDPETLKKTNMMAQIPDPNSRLKIAARAIMFEGKNLATPASFYMEVAGTEDIKNGVGKMMHYLVKAKPEFKEKAEALMKENFLKSPEQWNLPPEQQDKYKQNVSASIDPDHPDEMKISLNVSKGKADEIVCKIAALTQATAVTPSAAAKIADKIIAAHHATPPTASVAAKPSAAKECVNWAETVEGQRMKAAIDAAAQKLSVAP